MHSNSQSGRFVKEAKLLQKAQRHNLVQYLDFLEVPAQRVGDLSRFFLVLEHLKGMPGAGVRGRIPSSPSRIDPAAVVRPFQGYPRWLGHLPPPKNLTLGSKTRQLPGP